MAPLSSLIESYPLLYAVLGGILPALFWLWFWMQEDKLHPEPRGRVLAAFLGGMAACVLVYPVERYAFGHFGGINSSTIFSWALAEEFAKYLMVALIALHSRDFDEPLDAMTYIITVALGFAALENTLFILNPLLEGATAQSLASGGERFIGASLLHVVCSGIIGFSIAMAFYRTKPWKMLFRVAGISVAVALHAAFNLLIIYENGQKTLVAFSALWILVLVILLLFEKAKKINAQ